MAELAGVVEKIIFHNEQNGYTVAELSSIDTATDTDLLVTITGNFLGLKPGMYIKTEGNWTEHLVYGEQFAVSSYRTEVPTTIKGLKNYLSSGVLPGIGEQTAKVLLERFGEEFFDVLENNPKELLTVKGIGPKTLDKILKAYNEQVEMRDTMVQLQEYDISTRLANKLFDEFGHETINVLLDNPYQIALKVSGVGFMKADEIAKKLGYDKSDPKRIDAGIAYALQDCYRSGHTYMEEDDLIALASKLLEVDQEEIEHEIDNAVFDGKIQQDFDDGKAIYYPVELYRAEGDAALKISRLAKEELSDSRIDMKKLIKKVEDKLEFKLDESQKKAIEAVTRNPITIITGGPGSGKTTIINGLLTLFEELGLKPALAAPTGRAAQRITESTGAEAKTIHRLLEYEYSTDSNMMSFRKNAEEPIDADVVIIDESSMVDIQLFASLLDAIDYGTRLVLVGDADQLPSVGPGNVLSDLIDSGAAETVRLTDIHRQEKGSMISVNAHSINEGIVPKIDNQSDFMLVNKNDEQVALDTVIDLASERISRVFGYDKMNEIQVISPLKRGTLGTISLNAELQKKINPPSPKKRERKYGDLIYREGDKVMQIKNNYNTKWENIRTGAVGEGVYNGDIGVIEHMEEDGFIIRFSDGRQSEYDFSQLDEISHAYAVTVHKSQGSEFKAVVMPLMGGFPGFMNKRLLYTGVTRAKDKLVLIGQSRYFDYMVHNDVQDERKTRLDKRIKEYMETDLLF